MNDFLLNGDYVARVDVHVVINDVHDVNGNRLKRREGTRLACGELKLGAVRPALEGAVLNETFCERNVAVSAGVSESMNDSLRVEHDGDGRAVNDESLSGIRRKIGQSANFRR
jgi:hypothetical protein